MRPTMRNQVPNIVKSPRSEEGFAIPIALGMGLVMLLLGMTAIVRSQSDTAVAVDKKFSAQARTAAEIGITRVQDFLNRYRAAAAAPACSTDAKWPTSGYGACTDTTVMSWGFPNSIPNLCPGDQTAVDGFATNDWQSAGTAGEYRLVNYSYSGSTGTLTVEGRVNGGNTNEAMSKLQVTIPVTSPTEVPVASLWVTGSSPISGNPQINSDVVATSSTCADPGAFTNPSSTTNKLLSIKTPQSIPAAKNTPSSGVTTLTTISGKTLPQTGDMVDTTTIPGSNLYKYVVNSLDGSFNVTPGTSVTTSGVTTTTPTKVWLWVKGNIDLSDKVIVNQCAATIPSSTTLINPNCGPFDVRIYRDTSTTASSPTLILNKGTAVCDVFLHLPDFAVTFNNAGTATTQDCGGGTKNTGVYWVKSWAGAATSANVIDAPRATWGTAISSINLTTSFTTPPLTPQIGPGSGWDTQSN
jgi:hypothetical protein